MESTSEMNPSSNDIVLETEKIIIMKDKKGMYGEAAPSKMAPQYLQDLIGNSYQADEPDEEDDPSNDSSTFDSSCSRSYDELEEWKKRVQEEERLSRMYKLKNTFSLEFDNRAWLHPHGTGNFDYKSIKEERKQKFEKFKNRVRQENYQYMCMHPEIQGLISLAVKRLLQTLPDDPIKFLTEFFTARTGSLKDFEESVEAEVKKISKHHLSKMKATGQINMKSSTAVRSEISGETWRPEHDANFLKKLNIGALAQDFSFDPSSLKQKKTKKNGEDEKLKLIKKKKKCGKREYCGCKDWKLKKNQQENADMSEEHEEEVQTTTFSTLGNIHDNMLSSAEEEEDDEEEEVQWKFGDGEFLGEMEERVDAKHGNLTSAEAEVIAGLLVNEFIGGDGIKIGSPKK